MRPFDQKISDLLSEYNEQSQRTKAPGNPYLTGLHARAQGMKEVLEHPLYSAAQDMLDA